MASARVAPLAAIFDLNTGLLLNCVRDLTDEQAETRLGGIGNSIAFLILHMVEARLYLAGLLGAPRDEPILHAYADVKSIDEVGSLPALADLVRLWTDAGTHLASVLDRLPDEALDVPVDEAFPIDGHDTLSTVAFLAQHDSYHLGQIAFLRRQLGLPAMSYDREDGEGSLREEGAS